MLTHLQNIGLTLCKYNLLQTTILVLKIFDFFDISGFHPAIFRLQVVVAGFGNSGFAAHIFDGAPGFDRLQNGDDLVLGESDLAHSDLLR